VLSVINIVLNVFILGNEDSQFPFDDGSEASASETTETLNEEISSNRPCKSLHF
jgi:hypothetical protein